MQELAERPMFESPANQRWRHRKMHTTSSRREGCSRTLGPGEKVTFSRTSKHKLQPELNVSRITVRTQEVSKFTALEYVDRVCKVGRIQSVEELRPKLQLLFLCKAELLVKGEVNTYESRTLHNVSPRISKLARIGITEGSGVEEALEGLATDGTPQSRLFVLAVREVRGVTQEIGPGET